MKKTFLLIYLLYFATLAVAQNKYFTRTGTVSFFSKAPFENIEAQNNQLTGIIDLQTGELAFSVLMKGFEFEKALMQEHFNENYVESDKYPKSTFKGIILNYQQIDLNDEEEHVIDVEGDFFLHGENHSVTTKGRIQKKADVIETSADFKIMLADYNIKIPKAVFDNISEQIDIKILAKLVPYRSQ